MPRPRLGTEALTNAQRQKRKRSRRAHEVEIVRVLLRETTQALRSFATVRHLLSANSDVSICRLCSGFDEHTPQCLIYRAERALEQLEASP